MKTPKKKTFLWLLTLKIRNICQKASALQDIFNETQTSFYQMSQLPVISLSFVISL